MPLLDITLTDVEKQIYQETGASIYEIKKALRKAEGNVQEAMKILAERYHATKSIMARQPEEPKRYRIEA